VSSMAANTRAVQLEALRCKIGRSGTEISASLLCKLIYYRNTITLALSPEIYLPLFRCHESQTRSL
jgi:hypothetical protein